MSTEFFHHLRDTLILLGGERYFADLLDNPAEISEADVEGLRNYNHGLVESVKNRLANINRMGVIVGEV
jgi:hypothetical protein